MARRKKRSKLGSVDHGAAYAIRSLAYRGCEKRFTLNSKEHLACVRGADITLNATQAIVGFKGGDKVTFRDTDFTGKDL